MRFVCLVVLLALGGCANSAPAPAPASGDPINQGFSVWCGTNPPSGYCMYD